MALGEIGISRGSSSVQNNHSSPSGWLTMTAICTQPERRGTASTLTAIEAQSVGHAMSDGTGRQWTTGLSRYPPLTPEAEDSTLTAASSPCWYEQCRDTEICHSRE